MAETCYCGEPTRDATCPPYCEDEKMDYGDAPDDPSNPDDYPTRRGSNGARHIVDTRYHLGIGLDRDDRDQSSWDAAGDDVLDGNDDEDGVIFETPSVRGRKTAITVIASAKGYLDAWADFNQDGDWSDAGEQIFARYLLNSGENLLLLEVPERALPGMTFFRFRYSSRGGLSYGGAAPDGEVEDYWVRIF
jgi:hypothetical protein